MMTTQAILPLRLIFWGGLLCIFDFSYTHTISRNGQAPTGYRFDFLNDFLGMVLIFGAVLFLSTFAHQSANTKELSNQYQWSMRFILLCCGLNTIEAFVQHFVFPTYPVLDVLSMLLAFASLGATILFCGCMRELSIAYELHESAESWQMTRILMVVIWVIPLGLFYTVALFAIATGNHFHWNLGCFVFLLLLIFAIPLIHLFISTSRMRYEAEANVAHFEKYGMLK